MKKQIDADKARDILNVLESEVFKEFIEAWMAAEEYYLMENAGAAFGDAERPIDSVVKNIGRASGIRFCINRIITLRKLCGVIIQKEVENLKKVNEGGPTDAKV